MKVVKQRPRTRWASRFSKALLAACLLAAISSRAADSSDIGLLIDARLLLRKGAVADADREVRDYLQKHPDSAEGHYLLGFVLFKEVQEKATSGVAAAQDTARQSLAEYTEGAKYRPPSSLDLKVVALDYVLLGDYGSADKWLTRSIEWNPKDPEAWYYLGRIKSSEKSFQEAISAFDRCLKIDPQNTKAEEGKETALNALAR